MRQCEGHSGFCALRNHANPWNYFVAGIDVSVIFLIFVDLLVFAGLVAARTLTLSI